MMRVPRLLSRAWQVRVIGLICCLGAGGQALADSWIVAWKKQPLQSDASANVFVCERMTEEGDVTWFYKGSQKKGFQNNQFFRCARLQPALPDDLTNSEECGLIKARCEKLADFTKQFPKAAEFADPVVAEMQAGIDKFKAGKVRVKGKWIVRPDTLAVAAQHKGSASVSADALEDQRIEALELKRLNARKIAFATVGGIAIYLVFLLGALIRFRIRMALIMILLPLMGAGWLTYQEGGIDWFDKVKPYFMDLPALLNPPPIETR
jgi:hypothetical protein